MAATYYQPNYAKNPQFISYLNQRAATSGATPSASVLDRIIQGENEAAARNFLEERRLQEQKRQTDLATAAQMQAQEQARKAARSAGFQQAIQGVGQAAQTAATIAGKEGLMAAGKGLGSLAQSAGQGIANVAQGAGQGLYNLGASAVNALTGGGGVATGALGTGASTLGTAAPTVAGGVGAGVGTGVGTGVSAGVGATGISAASEAAALTAAMDAGIGAPVGMSAAEIGAGTGAGSGSSIASSVAGPLAIIAGAELGRVFSGGINRPWEDKNVIHRAMDSPVAAGLMSGMADLIMPGLGIASLFAKPGTPIGDFYKGGAALERTLMAPIDFIFGDPNAFSKQRLKDAGNFLMYPFGTSGAGKAITFAVNPVLGVIGLFCFLEGTPITMADGSTKPVEKVSLLDECESGGAVTGIGVVLSNEIYDYKGVGVTGSHAVYEDGEWVRVKDSKHGVKQELDGVTRVYIINNENHVLMVNGVRFADYGEVTDSGHMTEEERLAYLNENCRV